MSKRPYLAFKGKYGELKTRGFVFQKLYAGNYMQWALETQKHINNIRVWKLGAEVTVDILTNSEGRFFEQLIALRKAGKAPSVDSLGNVEYILNQDTFAVSLDPDVVRKYKDMMYSSDLGVREQTLNELYALPVGTDTDRIKYPYALCDRRIHTKCIAPVIEMIDEGWIEIAYREVLA